MRKILFRADASLKSGTGDLLSLIYLAEYFGAWKKYFLVRDTTEARKIIRQYREWINVVRFLPERIGRSGEIAYMNRFIYNNDIDAVFLEITRGSLNPYGALQAPFKACVDFYGKIPRNLDMVVNWDVKSSELYRKKYFKRTHFLLGPSYAVIRKKMLDKAISRDRKPLRRKVRNILVSFGGFDEFNFTLKAIKLLEKIDSGICLRVILGLGYKHRRELNSCLRGSAIVKVEIKDAVKDLTDDYLWADLVIISGGLSLFEALALKKNILAVSIYAHQIKRCAYFAKKRAINYAGFRKINLFALRRAISSNRQRLSGVGSHCRKITDFINERLDN